MAALSADEEYLSGYLAPYHGSTRARYAAALVRWLGHCIAARIHILEATPTVIEQWIRAERARGVSSRTINGSLTPILGLYRWAHAHGYIPSDPGAYVRRPSIPRRTTLQWLSREQLRSWLDAACATDPVTHSLACLYALNGLRLREGLEARIEHRTCIDGHEVLRLPHRKADVADHVAIPARTVEAIAAAAGTRQTGRIHRYRGRAITPQEVYRRFDLVTELAGIGLRVRPHMLRVSFVTLSLDAGVPVRDVMASTGHSGYSMVAHYDRGWRSIARSAAIPLSEWLNT